MSRFGDWARRQVDKLSDALSSKKPDEQHKDSALNNMDKAREGYDAAGGTHPKFNQAALDNTREDAKYREGDEKATQYTGSMIPKKEADKSQGASDFYGEMPNAASSASKSTSSSGVSSGDLNNPKWTPSRSNSSENLSASVNIGEQRVGDEKIQKNTTETTSQILDQATQKLENALNKEAQRIENSAPDKPLPPIPAPVLDDADKSRTFTKPEVQIVDKDTLPPAPSTSRAIPEDQRKMTYERDPVMTQLMESYNFEARTQAATKEIEKGPEISSSAPHAQRPPLERQNTVYSAMPSQAVEDPKPAINIRAADRDALQAAVSALAGKGDAGEKANPAGKEEAKGNDPTHPVVGKHTQDLANKESSNKNVGVGGLGG